MYDVFDGVRILEVASWTFVPTCGALCVDWGADVIKIEPPDGDPQRAKFAEELKDPSAQVMMDLPNRGKRSVGLDLRSPKGREVMQRLVRTADVLITNYLPAVRRRLGLDTPSLRAVNPRLIIAVGSGQGRRGPEADTGGYDFSSAIARSGLGYHMTGNDAPPPLPPAMLDIQSGFNLAAGIAGALFRRERSGRVSEVDVSLLASGLWMAAPNIMAAAFDTEVLRTKGRYDPPINPVVNTYRTRDGRWIYLVLLQSEKYWEEFCTRIGRPDLITDARFASVRARIDNKTQCVRELDKVFAQRSLEEWRAAFEGMQGPWAAFQSFKEVLSDPQVLANGYLPNIEANPPRPVVASPVQFDGLAIGKVRPTPECGQNTVDVLGELGYTAAELDAMKAERVVA